MRCDGRVLSRTAGWRSPRCVRIVGWARVAAAAACPFVLAACAGGGTSLLADATSAYNAAEYGRSLALARKAAENASGLGFDQARYLEGLSLLGLARHDDAVGPLSDATDAASRTLAADARISLGTALVRKGDFEAAANAYQRAAFILEGEEKLRALAIERECRAIARGDAAESTPAPAPAASATQVAGEAPSIASPTPAVRSSPTARIVNGVEIEPVVFAIQAGAFKDRAKALDLASRLRGPAGLKQLELPRVVEKSGAKGETLHVVQFGSFPNRTVAGDALRGFPGTVYTVERRIE